MRWVQLLVYGVCISASFLVARSAYAQPPSERAQSDMVSVGMRLGPNVTWFGGKDANTDFVDSTDRFGFFVGALATWRITSIVALQPEVMLTDKGTWYKIATSPSNREFRSKYLDVPILAKVSTAASYLVTPYLIAGPELSILVDCEIEVDGIVGDCADTSKRTDFGLVFGVGGTVELPWSGGIMFEVRYDHGLISFDDSELQQELMNRSVLFSIGYYHHLGASVN